MLTPLCTPTRYLRRRPLFSSPQPVDLSCGQGCRNRRGYWHISRLLLLLSYWEEAALAAETSQFVLVVVLVRRLSKVPFWLKRDEEDDAERQ